MSTVAKDDPRSHSELPRQQASSHGPSSLHSDGEETQWDDEVQGSSPALQVCAFPNKPIP